MAAGRYPSKRPFLRAACRLRYFFPLQRLTLAYLAEVTFAYRHN